MLLHLAEQESSGWLCYVSFMTSFEAIRARSRVVAELLLSVVDLKSPSAQTAGLIVPLPSSLWFGLWRKAAASNVAEWLCVAHVHRRWWTRSVCLQPTQIHTQTKRFMPLTGISVQLQKRRQTQIYKHTHRLPATSYLYMCQLTKTKEREHPSRAWIITKRQKSLVFFFPSCISFFCVSSKPQCSVLWVLH